MTQLITFKLQEQLLKQIDGMYSDFGFANRTDFIRNALREKVEEYRIKQAVLHMEKQRGFAKNRKITDEDLKAAGEKAFEKIYSRLK